MKTNEKELKDILKAAEKIKRDDKERMTSDYQNGWIQGRISLVKELLK